jgi:preprotein translocase subunit SecE
VTVSKTVGCGFDALLACHFFYRAIFFIELAKYMKVETALSTSRQTTRWEPLKWTIIWTLLAAGVAGNYYYASVPLSYRLAAWLVFLCVMLLIVAQTDKGQKLWVFAREARMELRKVIWPTRQETIRTTLVVVAVVVVVALFLWGLDAFLLWGAGFLTGQRG